MHFECIKELNQYFFLGLFSKLNIWVMLPAVDALDVCKLNYPVPVSVQFLESFFDKGNSLGRHLSNDSSQEFVVTYPSIMVEVEALE